jgi:hypothetical protein
MKHGQTHGGKGSSTRPTNYNNFADAYDAIFKRKKEEAEDLSKELEKADKQNKGAEKQ